MTKRTVLTAILAALLSALVYAGGNTEKDHEDHGVGELPDIDPVNLQGRKLRVTAATTIIGDVVSRAAGDAAELTVLMKRGQSPHGYSPSPREIAALEEADIIFVNGLGFEEGLINILESMDDSLVVSVSAGIEPISGDSHDDHADEDEHSDDEHDDDHADEDEHSDDEHDDHGEGGDPHFWFSPLNVIQWTENIEHALSAADPGNAANYAESAEAYIAELRELDADIREAVSNIPESDRKLVMDHQVIGYFAAEYDFEILGNILPSLSDQAEPSARELAELTEIIREEGIKAIFVGDTAGEGLLRLAESLAAEVGRDITVVPLLTGSLAEPGRRGADYIDFMRYSTEQITGALLGLN